MEVKPLPWWPFNWTKLGVYLLLQMGKGRLQQVGNILLNVRLVVRWAGGTKSNADFPLLHQVEHVGQDAGVHGQTCTEHLRLPPVFTWKQLGWHLEGRDGTCSVRRVCHHRENVLQDVAKVRLVETLCCRFLRRHVLQQSVQDLQTWNTSG